MPVRTVKGKQEFHYKESTVFFDLRVMLQVRMTSLLCV